MATRTRMSPADRRDQLLDLGARLFAEHPYDDVLVERVADAAGVSRGLLYHYFPTKRDFFLQLLQRESDRLLERTATAPGLDLREQLLQGVDRYLDHCREHRHGVVAVIRGAASGDPEVQDVVRRGVERQGARIVAALCGDEPPDRLLEITVRGWVEFLRSVALDWLRQDGGPAGAVLHVEIRDVAADTLIGALQALPPHARPAAVPLLAGS